jgi:hypothetical protein
MIQPGDLVLITNLETGATSLCVAEIPEDEPRSLRFVPVGDAPEGDFN